MPPKDQTYFRASFQFDEDANTLCAEEPRPSWGLSPHYLTESEISKSKHGPFKPELRRLYWDNDGGYVPDFIPLDYGVLTAAPHVFDAFESAMNLKAQSEIFESYVGEQTYVVLKPLIFLDLMNMETSTYRLSSKGTLINPKSIILKSAPPEDIHYFGLLHNARDMPYIFVSEDFKKIYDDNGFSGLRFKLSWPNVEGSESK
ncbi:hypothetical protein [Ascidiaceihabitans sp.]|uniref:hypothetical protein n=1 Tax=Ascidiaceihabitans sp. TaxID=1872644 RepID=UPI0032999500